MKKNSKLPGSRLHYLHWFDVQSWHHWEMEPLPGRIVQPPVVECEHPLAQVRFTVEELCFTGPFHYQWGCLPTINGDIYWDMEEGMWVFGLWKYWKTLQYIGSLQLTPLKLPSLISYMGGFSKGDPQFSMHFNTILWSNDWMICGYPPWLRKPP